MTKIGFLFPGQGSQTVGMGKDLYETSTTARAVLEQFSDWVSSDLLKVVFEGPEETLKRTQYTQPAILAVSMAALTAFQEATDIQPAMTAGHSLGEYGAMVAAGVMSIETAARLVKERAICMEQAPPGAMAAILGLEQTLVEQAVEGSQKDGVVVVANYNTPEQLIISGDPKAVEDACTKAKALGASRAMMLPVGGAFHSPLMVEADKKFNAYLKTFTFEDAQVPVVTNVDGKPTTQASELHEKLGRQITSSVRWTDSMQAMRDAGIKTYIEIGPGKVLAGMMKKIDREAAVYNIFDKASLEQTVEKLGLMQNV